jgi:hypothetical protein
MRQVVGFKLFGHKLNRHKVVFMALSPFRGKCSDLSTNLLSLGPKDQGNILWSSRPEGSGLPSL